MKGQNVNDKIRKDFENIFQKYSDVIYRLCLYGTSNETASSDLTQEAFFRLWNTMSADKEVARPKEYLYQITRNLIVDYYKRRKTTSLDDLREAGFDLASSDNSPEINTDISILKDCIDSLEEDYREVVYMRFIEGMKVQEIAEILGISENLASVRINRGKSKLREKFK